MTSHHPKSEVRLVRWIARWGFGAIVGAAIATAAFVGVTVAVPPDVPAVALQAAPVYRLEVGAAIFAGLYVIGMALVLALQNRGFAEFGTGGVRAQSLADLPRTLETQEGVLNVLLELVDEMGGVRDHRDES